MNYIELINHYWSLREQGILSAGCGDLYLYLIHKSNSLGWKNPFNQSNRHICAILEISEPTLIRQRNKLMQAGLLEFESGKAKMSNSVYYLKNISSSVSSIISSPVSSSDSSSVSSSDVKALDNTKRKQDKTKQKDSIEQISFVPPLLDEVKAYFDEKGYSEAAAVKAWGYYDAGDWKDSKGNKVKNWKQKMLSVWFKPENLKPQSLPDGMGQPGTPVKREMVY